MSLKPFSPKTFLKTLFDTFLFLLNNTVVNNSFLGNKINLLTKRP